MSFVVLDANDTKFFGFAEFIAALALIVIAWTIVEVHYRFRIRTAPLPLEKITFWMVVAVGILTLLTDLWRAEQWLVPSGNLVTPSEWQALLGGLFLLTFLTWAWFAFIRPPVYGKRNAVRYARALYRIILKGSPSELSIIADEFSRSVKSIIHYATDRDKLRNRGQSGEDRKPPKTMEKVIGCANDLLLLIGDKRFCRAIVESSPGTVLAVFHEVAETKKYGVQIETFARNVVNAALTNENSFLYHEAEGYESGLIGYHKPLSQAMFSNYEMVEKIGTLLDPDIDEKYKWDATQWKAYCRVVLITFEDYVKKGYTSQHSYVLYGAKSNIEHAVYDLYKIDKMPSGAWDTDVFKRLGVVVDFIKKAIEVLNSKGMPQHVQLRIRDKRQFGTFYDHLSDMIFEVIFSASQVESPTDLCWAVQHNSAWSEFFNFDKGKEAAMKVLQFKVRRLIYNEVADMGRFPNFKGASILSFCLNVMGLSFKKEKYYRDSNALHKAILSWTKKNFVWLHSYNPRVAEACLIGGITYEQERLRLVKTIPAVGLRREPKYIYFDLDMPSPQRKTPEASA